MLDRISFWESKGKKYQVFPIRYRHNKTIFMICEHYHNMFVFVWISNLSIIDSSVCVCVCVCDYVCACTQWGECIVTTTPGRDSQRTMLFAPLQSPLFIFSWATFYTLELQACTQDYTPHPTHTCRQMQKEGYVIKEHKSLDPHTWLQRVDFDITAWNVYFHLALTLSLHPLSVLVLISP